MVRTDEARAGRAHRAGRDLWDSIGSETLPPLADKEQNELERRLEEHRRDPSTAITWDELKAELPSRLK
ncbi:MAG: addiction module protein [Xanthobacteraceae bacterium]